MTREGCSHARATRSPVKLAVDSDGRRLGRAAAVYRLEQRARRPRPARVAAVVALGLPDVAGRGVRVDELLRARPCLDVVREQVRADQHPFGRTGAAASARWAASPEARAPCCCAGEYVRSTTRSPSRPSSTGVSFQRTRTPASGNASIIASSTRSAPPQRSTHSCTIIPGAVALPTCAGDPVAAKTVINDSPGLRESRLSPRLRSVALMSFGFTGASAAPRAATDALATLPLIRSSATNCAEDLGEKFTQP